MKWFNDISFVSRTILAMGLSILLNLIAGHFLESSLSQKRYVVSVDVDYSLAGTLQLLFDTGDDFNPIQQVNVEVGKGLNSMELPFELKEGGQLKFLRLDFGDDAQLSEVRLKSLSLFSKGKILFDLGEKEITKKVRLIQGVEHVDNAAVFKLDASRSPFDPYIVFSPINELIYPLWQRILLLIAPWLLLFFFPFLSWICERFEKKELVLFLAALFIASIPLKIAWVTFSALLLLAYSLFTLVKKKEINFSLGRLAILGLFLVPLLFIGQGEFSNLAVPLGFVIFPVICSILDFSPHYDEIKKIYTKVFFVLMSITIVSWVLLMGYSGYYYNLGLSNYFGDIKANAHLVMDWLYYPHTTFLSFFILMGGIFCLDLFKRQKIDKIYGVAYTCFAIMALLILGSRFAWALALLLPLLYFIPVHHLKRILIPFWAALFAGTVYFIDKLDPLRAELWQLSFAGIKKKPWIGHGTGNSDLVLPDQLVIEKNGTEAVIGINHSHNQFLTYLLENGLLGTMLFTALMLFIFYHFVKQNDKTMMLVTFSILLLMVVESPFMTATPLYLFSFLLCCFMGYDRRRNTKPTNVDNG